MYVEQIETFRLKNKVIVVELCLDTSFKEQLEKINVKHGGTECSLGQNVLLRREYVQFEIKKCGQPGSSRCGKKLMASRL